MNTQHLYNSSNCGSGKTEDNISNAIAHISIYPCNGYPHKVIFVCSSIDSSKEIYDRILKKMSNNHHIVLLNSDTSDYIIEDLNKHLSNKNNNQIIIICNQTFVKVDWNKLDSTIKKENIMFLIDEAFKVYNYCVVDAPSCHNSFHNKFTWTKVSKTFYKIKPIVESFQDNDVLFYGDVMRPITHALFTDQHDVFAHHTFIEFLKDPVNYEEQVLKGKKDYNYRFTFHTVFNMNFSEGAHSILMSGANIENMTEMGVLWNLKKKGKLMKNKGFVPHYNVPIKIYTTHANKWSKKIEKENQRIKSFLMEHFFSNSSSESRIFIDNNKKKNEKEGEFEIFNESKIKINNQGLNIHSGKTDVGCFCSLNYNHQTLNLFKEVYKITPQHAQMLRHIDTKYQTTMRSALRVVGNQKMVCVWILRSDFAEYIKNNYFPDAEIEVIGPKMKTTKLPPLRRSEYSKAERYKKKHPELKHLKPRQILEILNNQQEKQV